jgi:succinyl-diaminopimelate desuccinylase
MSKEIPQSSILDLAQEMILIPSSNDRWIAKRKLLDAAADFLGPDVFSFPFFLEDKNGNLIASRIWGNPDTLMTPRLLLCGHVDVADEQGDNSLFEPWIQNDILYGRGAADMKGNDAAMLVSYRRWIVENGGTNGVGLLLTTDEEKGGFSGARNVIDQGLKPNVVYLPDGLDNYDIVESQKAPHHFEVNIRGRGGHGARAFELDNPLDRLFNFYQEARDRLSKATIENPWASTFEMTRIEVVNLSMNSIPGEVKLASFAWRFPPEQISFQDGLGFLRELCHKYGLNIVKEEGGGEGCLTDRNAGFVLDWKNIIEGVIGHSVRFANAHGASDGRHFYNHPINGSKNILLTSSIGGGQHDAKEWVNIQSLYDLSEAIYRYQKQIINNY